MSTPEMLVAADTARRGQSTLGGEAPSRDRLDRETLDLLREVPLFAGLSRRHVRRIGSLATIVSYPSGRTIVERNTRGDSFYLLLRGEAKVYRGIAPTGRAIARLNRGDFFGEMALLDGGPRSATVVSDGRVTALKVPRVAFRQLVLREPLVALRVLETMAARARQHESSPRH